MLVLHFIHSFMQIPHHLHRVHQVVECFFHNGVARHVPCGYHDIKRNVCSGPRWAPKMFRYVGSILSFRTSSCSFLIFKFNSCSLIPIMNAYQKSLNAKVSKGNKCLINESPIILPWTSIYTFCNDLFINIGLIMVQTWLIVLLSKRVETRESTKLTTSLGQVELKKNLKFRYRLTLSPTH